MVLDSFFDRFWGSWEALGDHLRPPLGDLGDTLGAGGGSLWLTLGALESLPEDSGATLWSLGGDFGVRGLMYVTFFAKYGDSFKDFLHCSVHGSSRIE